MIRKERDYHGLEQLGGKHKWHKTLGLDLKGRCCIDKFKDMEVSQKEMHIHEFVERGIHIMFLSNNRFF